MEYSLSTNISQLPNDAGDTKLKRRHLACPQSVHSLIRGKPPHNRQVK